MSIESDDKQSLSRQVRVNLIKLRANRNLTLAETARLTGLDEQSHWRYEAGTYMPNIYSLEAICSGLGISSNEILGF